jgi:hypothetical protein
MKFSQSKSDHTNSTQVKFLFATNADDNVFKVPDT